jgi:hypothetical protein
VHGNAWAFRNEPPADGYYLNTDIDNMLAAVQTNVNAALNAKPNTTQIKAMVRRAILVYGD